LLVAGIDCSTQSCKVAVRDSRDGRVVRSSSTPIPGGPSIDPEIWWSAVANSVADAGGLDDVVAISIAAQQHGMVLLDRAGRVLRDALLWHDTSSAPQARHLTDELGREAWVSTVGMSLSSSFTVTKIRWLRDNEPQTAADVAAVALPHDWLTWRLRGFGPEQPDLDELVTDRSDASGTGYWSPFEEDYRMDIVERALGRTVLLPRVLPWGGTAGKTADVIPGVPAGIPVGVGGGDNALAAFGLGIGPGDVVISVGTSGTIYTKSVSPVKDLSGPVATYADATGNYLPLVAVLNAARVLDAGQAIIGGNSDRFAAAALNAPPGASGVTLLPFFEGERYPDLPAARASLHGLSLQNCVPENIARAFVEGVACSLANGLDAMRDTGLPADRVILIGGGAKSIALQASAADVFDLPVVIPTPHEYVTLGAAKQAVLALGESAPDWRWSTQKELMARHPTPWVRDQYRRAYQAALRGEYQQ